jgi:hypothetical protein
METIITILIIITFIFIFYIYLTQHSYVKSKYDEQFYQVANATDKEKASDTLARIKHNLMILKDYLVEHKDDPDVVQYKKNIELMEKNINDVKIRENLEPGKHTSYLQNKGEELVMCLRSSKNNKIHDFNILMFVAIHELTHAADPEYVLTAQHPESFQKIFSFLLKTAILLGLYKYENYSSHNIEYCGIEVSENPLTK